MSRLSPIPIASVANGLAQGALDSAVAYARERETFGSRIIDHQGLAFVLADMEAAIVSARATMLHAARMGALSVGGAPESLAVELEAGEIEVRAEVEVTCVAEPQRHIA